MFHERGAEAAGSHEETRRIAANIAEAAEAFAQVLTRFHRVHASKYVGFVCNAVHSCIVSRIGA